jgi:hypothetical protein
MHLTFIKSCRFIDVLLLEEGIQTRGHLWKLGKKIRVDSSFRTPFEKDSPNGLTGFQRWSLKRLIATLTSRKLTRQYNSLANDLENYLRKDSALSNGAKPSFAKKYKDLMARELVRAMQPERNKLLQLACMVGEPTKQYSPYSGIFVVNRNSGGSPKYVFTSSRPARTTFGDTEKHVSLAVDWRGYTEGQTPRLFTRTWMNGICFFTGCPTREVLFPWPSCLTE